MRLPCYQLWLLLSLCLRINAQPPDVSFAQPQPPAQTLPEFRFQTMDQRTFSNTDLPKGPLLLFVFVDPDCDHCKRTVQKMDEQHGAFGKAALYFISSADPAKIRSFADSYARHLKVLWLRDADQQFMVRFRPIRYPALFLYSTDKKLLDYEDNEETIFRIVRSIARYGG